MAGSGLAAHAAAPADPVLAGTHHGRVTKTWSLDRGAFTAAPAPRSSRPVITEARALQQARAAFPELRGSAAGRLDTLVEGYGLVTVRPGLKQDTFSPPRTTTRPVLDRFTRRPAWIVADRFDGVTSCPAIPVSVNGHPVAAPPVYPTVPTLNYHVLAIDAVTGQAAIEFGQQGNAVCSGKPHPSLVAIPMLTYSVPFTRLAAKANDGGVQLSYTVPACAQESGSGGGGSGDTATVEVDVLEPFGTPAHCKPAFVATVDEGTHFQHFVQAPVGLVTRNGAEFGPPKPATADV